MSYHHARKLGCYGASEQYHNKHHLQMKPSISSKSVFVPGCRYGRRTWWAKHGETCKSFQTANLSAWHRHYQTLGPGKGSISMLQLSNSSWFLMAPEPPLWGEWKNRPSFHHSPSGPPDRKFGIAIRACFHGCTCQAAPRNREDLP